jgi:osmotically-inducible protein OsmY
VKGTFILTIQTIDQSIMKSLFPLSAASALLMVAGCAYDEGPATYNGTTYGRPAVTTSSSYSTYRHYNQSPYVTNGTYSYTPSLPGDSYLQSPSSSTSTTTYSSLPNESVNTSVDAQVLANPTYRSGNAPVTQVTGSDDALAAAVRQQLGNYGRLSTYANTLDISAYQGAVTLSGLVGNRQDRDAIDAVVRNIQGVTSVNDKLQVAGLPTGTTSSYVQSSRVYVPNAAPAPAQPVQVEPIPQGNTADMFNLHVRGLNDADRDVAQRIIQGLQTDSAVATMMPKVNITVEGGRVVLRGTVQNEQQRRQIINAVSQAAGTSVNADELQVGSNLNYR